jgi:hypothetical protein
MAAPTVREIPNGESHLAHAAMVELGRDVGDVERFARTVDNVLRGEGYQGFIISSHHFRFDLDA